MIMSFFSVLLAGIWPLVWHFGTAVGVMIIAFAVWWFSPSETIKKLAMIVIVITGAGLAGFTLGVRDANVRWKAKWVAAEKAAVDRGTSARNRAVRDARRGVRHDPQDIDH